MDRQTVKPEIAAQRRMIKLPPAIGDWTQYKPLKILVKKVKSGLYGFDRLSDSELDLVLRIHYRYIQALLTRFKIDLKMGVELCSLQVEQTTYLNFLRGVAGPTVQAKINIPDLHDPVFCFLHLSLANTIINFSLGSYDLEPLSRTLTDAENIVLTAAMDNSLPDYSDAFDNIFSKPEFNILGSPDIMIDPSINTSATFVCFSAEVNLSENSFGRIYFAYLGSTLRSFLAKYKEAINQKPLDFSLLSPSLLSKIMIPIKASLGNATLTSSEIEQIEEGDVVTLDATIDSPVALDAGSVLKLFCQPGVKSKKAAIRITAIRESEEAKIAPPSLVKEETPTPAKPAPSHLPPSPPPPPSPSPAPKEEIPADEEDLKDDLLDEELSDEEFTDEDFADEDFADDELLDENLEAEENIEEEKHGS
ncbi:MAG: FliM/FliN family flagellar motor switch protein [Candidatus Margulisbacteria bacterium]|nr:FliM/FliN family flagellar motor switch protein [Candidatus Margulisiibacteriota bacterium]